MVRAHHVPLRHLHFNKSNSVVCYALLLIISYTNPWLALWHRGEDGVLRRGSLRLSTSCNVKFDIYTPYDLTTCPSVVLFSRGVHSHSDPFPTKTPPPILDVFTNLLLELDWKLADATPRKLMIDAGFISSLRKHLQWSQPCDPSFSDLHPSLGNLDHVRRHITQLRKTWFPKGTDFEGETHYIYPFDLLRYLLVPYIGAILLAEQHQLLPLPAKYVRCAETHQIEGGKEFRLVICMSNTMSGHLLDALYISIDTSFKRVHGKWQEFEMETWKDTHMKCMIFVSISCTILNNSHLAIVAARAFTTSQSAHAHLILFRRIFEIAQADTGQPVRFHYIHGTGFRTFIADSHRGQALGTLLLCILAVQNYDQLKGLGMYCQYICRTMHTPSPFEPLKTLQELTSYEHLCHFFRLCTVHFKRNIHDLRQTIPSEVSAAMYSLASSQVLANLDDLLQKIQSGGPAAKGNQFLHLYKCGQELNCYYLISMVKGQTRCKIHFAGHIPAMQFHSP